MEMKTLKTYYAIDPDIEKVGLATFTADGLKTQAVAIERLFQHGFISPDINQTTIRIEAGWLNKGNWHVKKNMQATVAAEIGRKVGMNHAAGILLARYFRDQGYKVELVRPRNSKVRSATFEQLSGIVTKNQEAIDAAMLLFDLWGKS